MQAVREHWESVVYLKRALKDEDALAFVEAWFELPEEAQIALWISTKGGGVWTTKERAIAKEWMGDYALEKMES